MYNDLKEKTDYLIYHLNKIIKKLPEFIQELIDRLFNYNNINLNFFKQQYDPEVIKKREKSFKGFNFSIISTISLISLSIFNFR